MSETPLTDAEREALYDCDCQPDLDLREVVRYHGAHDVLDAVLAVAAAAFGHDHAVEKVHEHFLARASLFQQCKHNWEHDDETAHLRDCAGPSWGSASLPAVEHDPAVDPLVEHRCTLCGTCWTAPVLKCPHCGPIEKDQ